MSNWFEAVIKYNKTGDDGIIITTSENYLLDALTFAEAEERISREMKPFISGEFLVARVVRRKIAELFFSDSADADKWYSAKVAFVTLDEEKGVEKREYHTYFSQAENMKDALTGLIKGLKGTLADYEIISIKETKVMDVFKYEAADQKGGENE